MFLSRTLAFERFQMLVYSFKLGLSEAQTKLFCLILNWQDSEVFEKKME